ncbi:hypothetical protein D3C84_917580 [compost metagenome]
MLGSQLTNEPAQGMADQYWTFLAVRRLDHCIDVTLKRNSDECCIRAMLNVARKIKHQAIKASSLEENFPFTPHRMA